MLFKARTDSQEVNEKKKKWGSENDKCEKCSIEGEIPVETLEHLLLECKAYDTERNRLENKIISRIGLGSWEMKKMGEDKGIKMILGLERNREVMKDTKQFLKEIWKKRGKKEQRQKVKENMDHNYSKK